jgi:hypothetical protein
VSEIYAERDLSLAAKIIRLPSFRGSSNITSMPSEFFTTPISIHDPTRPPSWSDDVTPSNDAAIYCGE